MQFSTITILLAAAFTVSAAPGPDVLSKRTCGTLKGNALKACQEACKVTCDVATAGIARKLCKEACDLGPLKARDEDAAAVVVAVDAAPAPAPLAKRTCGTLTGNALKACQEACKITCDVGTGGLARKLCKEACDLGPLKARDEEAAAEELAAEELAAEESAAEESATDEVAKRSFGKKLCDGACDVTCNSTVLALDQLECLKVCKAKC